MLRLQTSIGEVFELDVIKDFVPRIGGWAMALGAYIAAMMGGWSHSLTALCILMAVDYLSGLAVAGVFGKSQKTANGGLESRAGWKGLVRKIFTLALVLACGVLDSITGQAIIRDGVAMAFILNEAVSITENAGMMDIPIPQAVKKALEVLKAQSKEQ